MLFIGRELRTPPPSRGVFCGFWAYSQHTVQSVQDSVLSQGMAYLADVIALVPFLFRENLACLSINSPQYG